MPTPASGTVQVPGNSDWVATGVFRNPGEEVIFCGQGEVRAYSTINANCWEWVTPGGLGRLNFTSANTPCTTCPILSLIAKVGQNGTPFFVGERGVIQSSDSPVGEIFLRINDATINDNSEVWDVTISKNCSNIADCFANQFVSSTDPEVKIEGIDILATPNPSNGIINLEFKKAGNVPIEIKIFSAAGTLIYNSGVFIHNDTEVKQIALPKTVTNGVYLLYVTIGNRAYSKIIAVTP